MLPSRKIAGIFLLLLLAAPAARADITMTVIPSPAPNFNGSPSWAGYLANGMNSIENNLGNIGNRSFDPTAYVAYFTGQVIPVEEAIVSSFKSWRGLANPAVPFDLEKGNRIHFGLHIVSDGTMPFRLEDLLFETTSSDGNILGFSGDFVGMSYSSTRIGIDYGGDNMKGGGDDIIINSGLATQMVDELIYIGVGNAYDATSLPGPSNQEKLDQVRLGLSPFTPIMFTGTYTLNDSGGGFLASGSSHVFFTPEPSTALPLAILAAMGLLYRRRR